MAPAAKDSKNGKIVLTFKASMAPTTPAIGSTIPLRDPMIKDFLRLMPSLLKGSDTAEPSGKFCNPIPRARPKAARVVAPSI